MKLFQKFLRRRLTPVEQLAEYESQIAYNQTIINNAETQIELATNLIPCFTHPDKNEISRKNRRLHCCYGEGFRRIGILSSAPK